MKFAAWLEAERGRAIALAQHEGVTSGAITQWKSKGVPVERMKSVRDFTNNEVTLEEMVPGPDEPEVPEERRHPDLRLCPDAHQAEGAPPNDERRKS